MPFLGKSPAKVGMSDDAVTNAKMADDAIGIAELSATGTASATTFLRGDNSWVAVGGAYNDWEVKTSGSPFTASAKDQLLINSGSAYTANLPAGADGNSIIICCLLYTSPSPRDRG